MVVFIPHRIKDIKGVEVMDILMHEGSDFMVSIKLVHESGKRSDPLALHQVDGNRRTLDAQGNVTTLRKLVYGKAATIKWLDTLFSKVEEQLSGRIGKAS